MSHDILRKQEQSSKVLEDFDI